MSQQLKPLVSRVRSESSSLLDTFNFRIRLVIEAIVKEKPDREFLPEALSIIDTPPSPIKIAFLYVIFLALISTILLLCLFSLDVYVVASGRVQPLGRIKVIQPLKAGKVAQILAKNGDHVEKDSPLIELDQSEALAAKAAAAADLWTVRGEIICRKTLIEAVSQSSGISLRDIQWTQQIPTDIRERLEAVYRSALTQYTTNIESFQKQIAQTEVEKQAAARDIATSTHLIEILTKQVEIRQELAEEQFGTKLALIDAQRDLLQARIQQVAFQESMQASEAAIDTLTANIRKTKSDFIADNEKIVSESERSEADLMQHLEKAELDLKDSRLLAPVSGTVQALAVTTIGQVVDSGQKIMWIVPESTPLEVEAYVRNQDIGFLKEGQEATIKIDAYPFTRYGTVKGRVIHIAADAVSSEDAHQDIRDATNGIFDKDSALSPAERTNDLVYAVVIGLESTELSSKGLEVPMKIGMAVNVEIQTKERRAIEYFLSPISDLRADSLKER